MRRKRTIEKPEPYKYRWRQVKYVREERRISAQTVAATLGMSYDRYRGIELGLTLNIKPEEKQRIAMFFGLPEEELFLRDEGADNAPSVCRVIKKSKEEIEKMLFLQFGNKLRAVKV